MGYRVVHTDEVESAADRPCETRSLTGPAGLSKMAMNRFTPRPGEQIPLAYHYHDEQEETFYVISGRLEVETPDGTYELGPADLFAVEPGSPQRAYVPEDADEPADVLAVGAPADGSDVHKYEP